MPRRNSGRPAPRAPSRPAAKQYSTATHPPATAHHAPPPTVHHGAAGGSMMGSLAGTIAQGLAFGTGSAVAHRAVDSVMGPRQIEHMHTGAEPASQSGPAATSGGDACFNQLKSFQDCVSANGDDIGKCQFYIDMLNECRRGPTPVL